MSQSTQPKALENLNKVVEAVGYPTFVKACFADVSAKARMEIFREKAEKQNVDWLKVFLDDGVFAFNHAGFSLFSTTDRKWIYHPLELPYIEALMKSMKPQTVLMMQDPITGNVFGKARKLNYYSPSHQFRQVFAEIVQQFVQSYSGSKPVKVHNTKAENAFVVNSGMLLTMALSMGDKPSAQALLDCAPEAWSVPLLMGGRQWGTPALSCVEMSRPDGLAMLTTYGYRSSAPVKFEFEPTPSGDGEKPPSVAPPLGATDAKSVHKEDVLTASTLVTCIDAKLLLDGADKFLPGTLVSLARSIKLEGELMGQPLDVSGQNDHFRGAAGDALAESGRVYLSRNNVSADQDIVDCLAAEGALERCMDRVIYAAVASADRQTLERFKDQINWPAYGGDSFLPTVLADSLEWRTSTSPDPRSDERLVTDLCEWCVKSGHADMLRDAPGSVFPDHNEDREPLPAYASPLHAFARHGLVGAAAFAISAGADPEEKPSKNGGNENAERGLILHPEKSALDLARQFKEHSTLSLFLSVAAKKAGLKALGELSRVKGSTLGTGP